MVSSPAALRETLGRRINSIVETRTVSRINGGDSQSIKQLLKDYDRGEFMEDEDKELIERYIETRKIQQMYAERTNEVKTLRDLLASCENLINSGQDSKLKWLTDFLKGVFEKDPQEKAIVFTEYRDTLDYLRAELE